MKTRTVILEGPDGIVESSFEDYGIGCGSFDLGSSAMHPNCKACNDLGHNRLICPNGDIPGFTCTVDMEHDQQEDAWLVGKDGWVDSEAIVEARK